MAIVKIKWLVSGRGKGSATRAMALGLITFTAHVWIGHSSKNKFNSGPLDTYESTLVQVNLVAFVKFDGKNY